jgi:predicted metal-binding protein
MIIRRPLERVQDAFSTVPEYFNTILVGNRVVTFQIEFSASAKLQFRNIHFRALLLKNTHAFNQGFTFFTTRALAGVGAASVSISVDDDSVSQWFYA